MRNAIVTGSTGFVGNALVKKLADENVHVYALVRDQRLLNVQSDRKKILQKKNVKLIEGDISNISEVVEKINESVDVFYHLAWVGTRGDHLTDYNVQISNIKYVMDAINVAAELGCQKFVGAGSISEYELYAKKQCGSEGDKHSVYKAAKHACYLMGKEYAKTNNIQFIWPIITNIYGPGENSPRLINSLVRNLITKGEQDLSEGNQIYDFVYITDAANAFFLIGKYGKSDRNYVVGSGEAKPLKQFLQQIPTEIDCECKLNFGKMLFNGYYLDKKLYSTDTLCEDVGYLPEVPFIVGIRNVIDYVSSQK